MQSRNKRILLNTLFLYIRLVFTLIVSLYTTRVVLQVLGVIDYGIYNIVAGFVSMFALLNNSMVNSVQRFYNYEKGRGNLNGLKSVYNMSVRIQLMIGLITIILLELIGVWYINDIMVIPEDRLFAANCVFQFSAFSLLFIILQIPYSAACISHEKMNFYAAVGLVDAVAKLLIALCIPYTSGDRLILYSCLLFGISFVNFLLYYFYAKSQFHEIKMEKGFDKILFGKLASFSGWNILDSISYTVQGQGMNMVLNSFFGPIVNAARGVAYQIQGVVFGFSSNLSVAFKPQLVESYASADSDRTKSLFFTMSKACFFMQYVLSLPIILELDYILSLWLGNSIPQHTVMFVRLVLLNSIIDSFNMPMSQVVQATGHIKTYQIARSLVLILVLPLSYAALCFFDFPEVVFIVMILITIIMQPLSLILMHKVFTFSYREYMSKVILRSLLFSVLVLLPLVFSLCLVPPGIFRIMLSILLDIIFSLLLAWLIFLSKSERSVIVNYISERLNISFLKTNSGSK